MKTKFFPNLLLCCSICFFKSFTSLSFLFNDFLKHLLIFGFYSNNKVIQSFSWKIPPDSYYFEKKLLNRKVGNWKRFVYISDWHWSFHVRCILRTILTTHRSATWKLKAVRKKQKKKNISTSRDHWIWQYISQQA